MNNVAPELRRAWLSQPIYRLLLLAFLLISILPLAFLGTRLYQAAWDDAWREIREKHQLLAENLGEPIRIYIQDHLSMLRLLADELEADAMLGTASKVAVHADLQAAFMHLDGFRSLALVTPEGMTLELFHEGSPIEANGDLFQGEACIDRSVQTGSWALSPVKRSPLTGNPTIVMSQPVYDQSDEITAVLLAELSMDTIEKVRRSIKFGEKGHSAIVDNTGHVIAHPDPDWMKEMRDLSHLPVVKTMLAGGTGVTEFYSPFVKRQMVAGYASVKDFGWGIMVPQPKSEVEAQVHGLLYTQFGWGLVGFLCALLLAIPIVIWITRPINLLADAAMQLSKQGFAGELPKTPEHAPREINLLDRALRNLVAGFQASREQINELNRTLQTRVEQATEQLQVANTKLEHMVRSDHLTSISNRRHFELSLSQSLNRRAKDTAPICILLIDIDDFKKVNDEFGHAAGDKVLTDAAALLKQQIRPGDVIARYGGDEFVAQMDCTGEAGKRRAEEIRRAMEKHTTKWRGKKIQFTVSIGVLSCENTRPFTMDNLLRQVDMAMYEAKRLGRNTVSEMSCEA